MEEVLFFLACLRVLLGAEMKISGLAHLMPAQSEKVMKFHQWGYYMALLYVIFSLPQIVSGIST